MGGKDGPLSPERDAWLRGSAVAPAPPPASSTFETVATGLSDASGRTPQLMPARGQAGPHEHLIATHHHRRSHRRAQRFSRCFPGPGRCSCGPARGRGAVGCGPRPEAVPGSASTRPNRDGAAGGIREGEQRLELQGREERLLSATLASEDMALALAATGRSIPVWPRARGARHRLRPHPAAQGAPRSGWAV